MIAQSVEHWLEKQKVPGSRPQPQQNMEGALTGEDTIEQGTHSPTPEQPDHKVKCPSEILLYYNTTCVTCRRKTTWYSIHLGPSSNLGSGKNNQQSMTVKNLIIIKIQATIYSHKDLKASKQCDSKEQPQSEVLEHL